MKPEQRAALLTCPLLRAYVGVMLQDLQNQENGEALEASRAARDVGPADSLPSATLRESADDCAEFKLLAKSQLARAAAEHGYTPEQAGGDLWLTRTGHGTGFWDRGLGAAGDEMAEMCGYGRPLGHLDAYLGDNGLVYVM